MIITVDTFIYFLLVSFVISEDLDDKIEYYTKLIEDKIESSKNYQLPTDASSYKPFEDDYSTVYGKFNFIVVGAGSAGTVIANRLSENRNWNVLLLEAGKYGDEVSDIPAVGSLNLNSDYNWGYKSTPQTHGCLGMKDKRCNLPRGRGVGGTTIVNDLMYSRGNKKDFDLLEKHGNPGWSYRSVLPLFKRSEHLNNTDPKSKIDPTYHGYHGELNTEFRKPRSEFADIFFAANNEIGTRVVDYNGFQQLGCSRPQENIKDAKRWSGGNAFIKPILMRENLRVLSECLVTKVLINNVTKIAYGVEFANQKRGYTVLASKEVILSAGAIGSPQILILSGIGPKDHLRDINVPLIYDLPVGRKYKTHTVFTGLSFSSNFSVAKKTLKDSVKEYLQGEGPLTGNYNTETIGFYQTSIEKIVSYPDLEIVAAPPADYLVSDSNDKPDFNSDFGISPVGLHSHSFGTLQLKSNSPFEYPIIDSNILSDLDQKDILTIYEGIQIILKLIQTEPFKKINAKLKDISVENCKEFEYLSKEYWICAIRQFGMDAYHPVGTCPMGPDPIQGAVVNCHLKVHGIERLRVADASIFPDTLTGHPSAPCVMVGEKVAHIIKKYYFVP